MSRQGWIFVALGMLALTSLLASIGAWLLLWRDRSADAGAATSQEAAVDGSGPEGDRHAPD